MACTAVGKVRDASRSESSRETNAHKGKQEQELKLGEYTKDAIMVRENLFMQKNLFRKGVDMNAFACVKSSHTFVCFLVDRKGSR